MIDKYKDNKKKWASNNKEKIKEINRKYRKEHKSILNEKQRIYRKYKVVEFNKKYRNGLKCSLCGSSYYIIYHHKDPSTKLFTVRYW